MKRDLSVDLEQLENNAFRMKGRCGSILEQFHALQPKIDAHPASRDVWQIYDWLLVPYSLWPIDFVGIAKHIIGLVEAGVEFDSDIVLLLNLIGGTPDKETQSTVGAFEHFVEAGKYDHLLKAPEKFKESRSTLQRDAELKKSMAAN